MSHAVTNSNEIQQKSESKLAYNPKTADIYDTASVGTFTSKNSIRSSKIDPHIGRQRQPTGYSESEVSGLSGNESEVSGNESDSGRSYSRVPPITTTIRPITRPIIGIKGSRNRGGSKSKKRNKTVIKRRNKRQTKKRNKRQTKRQNKRQNKRKTKKSKKNQKNKKTKKLNKKVIK